MFLSGIFRRHARRLLLVAIVGCVAFGSARSAIAQTTNNNPDKEFNDLIEILKNRFTRNNTNEELRKKLQELVAAIRVTDCEAFAPSNPLPIDPRPDRINCYIGNVVEAVNQLTAALTVNNTAKPVEPNGQKEKVEAAIKALKAVLPKEEPKDPPPQSLKINVLAAYYGDAGAIGHAVDTLGSSARIDALSMDAATRFCAATGPIRNACQGEESCLGPLAATITPTICGFEPVPYASPRVRGLVVAYQCAPKAKATFFACQHPVLDTQFNDKEGCLASSPAPATGKSPSSNTDQGIELRSAPNVLWAFVRPGENTLITCTGKKPAAKDAGDNE
jgi:hypothetical protein